MLASKRYQRCALARSADVIVKGLAPRRRPGPAALVGWATAVDADLPPGVVVVASELRAAGGTIPLPGAAPLVAALAELGIPVRSGPVACADESAGAGPEGFGDAGAVSLDADCMRVVRKLREGSGAVAVVQVIVDPGSRRHRMLALRRLRGVVSVLPQWAQLAQPRRVVLAGPRSFCAGVERAIDAVERALQRYPHPVYVRRQIVHNGYVVANLCRRGAIFVDELDEVPDRSVVVLSAHGVPQSVRAEAQRRELTVIDGTCPLVTKVHQEVDRFVAEGRAVLFIGHRGHDETEGTLGQRPGHVQLLESPEDAGRLAVPDPARVAVLTQTTLAPEDAAPIADLLRARFPQLAEPGSDDICYATRNRQRAVRAVAREADVVLVLGSANSSNSRRLVEVAHRCAAAAYLIEDATAIHPSWLAGARTVGLTAGASAPPQLVDNVLATLRDLGEVEVVERTVARETQTFSRPRGVAG